MDPIRFTSRVRYWNPDTASGLAVADVPVDEIPRFGGLRQQRVRGTVSGVSFASNVMPAGNGRLAVSMSKAILKAAGIGVGDEVAFVITGIGRE